MGRHSTSGGWRLPKVAGTTDCIANNWWEYPIHWSFVLQPEFRALFLLVHLTRFLRERTADIAGARTSALFPVRVPIWTVRTASAILLAAADGFVTKRKRAELLFGVDGGARQAGAAFLHDAAQARVYFVQLSDLFFAQVGEGT